MMLTINIDEFKSTPLRIDPYQYLIVPDFLNKTAITAIEKDYPRIKKAGSFPLETLSYGKAFSDLIEELKGTEIRQAFEEKFHTDLKGKPTTITVRGHCQEKDGKIHNDSKTKIITALLYMNQEWAQAGGKLRILRSGNSLENFAEEVTPQTGTLVAFKRNERSFHGHKTFTGQRRVIQMNWVSTHAANFFEISRHKISAWMKSVFYSI